MYENIKKIVEHENATYMERAISSIMGDSTDTALQNNSTATRWAQYKAGTINRETAVSYAVARVRKQYGKRLEKNFSRLDLIATAADVKSVSISVVWYKNRYWGYNPTATVQIETTGGYYSFEGHASGCGYDKETAAIGEALNKCNAILKMLCTKKETAISGLENVEYSNRNYIAYGAGYGAIPYFEGGVGMSSFESVFNACGLILRNRNETKTTNYYYFERKEVA